MHTREEKLKYEEYPDYVLIDIILDKEDKIKLLEQENAKLKELCDKYEEEHKTTFIEWQKDIKVNKKAIEIIEEEPYVEICGRWFTKSEYDVLVKDEEEKKIPEKLEQIMSKRGKYNSIDELAEEVFKAFETINDLIINQNQLIDYLKSKGDE